MMDTARADAATTAAPARISAAEFARILRADRVHDNVVDIRTEAEVRNEHIAGTKHVPLDRLENRIDEVRTIEGPIYLLCRSGKRAETAHKLLSEAGIDRGIIIDGGILAFGEAGGDTVVDEAHMSLERQVRIAAGSLVLLGVVLGFQLHPWFFWLSGFVGAGLVFAGVTDTCGMGMLLAKMPWNRST